MKSIYTLTTLITVLAAALIGIAPIASRAAENTPDSPDELRSDSKSTKSNSSQCPLGQSPLPTDCATTGMDKGAKTTNSMQPVEGNHKQAPDKIDITSALLEDLIKTDKKKAYAPEPKTTKR